MDDPTVADVRRIVIDCDDRCQDPEMHDFYKAGGGFRWCWPKFDRTHPADRRRRAALNRYPHNVIGAHVVLFGRGWGVRWKASQRPASRSGRVPDQPDSA
jgi:hypothetical protein